MTIVDSYVNLYNYNLVCFLWYVGGIFVVIGSIISFVMMLRDSYFEASMFMTLGFLMCALFFTISVFLHTDKDITCYKVVLKPSFTEEEFNTITTGFFIDSYKDGFWYLEELNPNNEVQKPNTQQERHMFYLIYSGDEGGMEDLENSATEAKDKSEPITSAEEPAKIEPITSTEEPAKLEPITSTEEHDKLEPSASTEVNFYSILQEANQGKDKEINTLYEILNKPFQVIRENQR